MMYRLSQKMFKHFPRTPEIVTAAQMMEILDGNPY